MQKIETMFLEAGLRPTKARMAVLKTIADANNALSHPEILEHLAGHKEFDRVTIYRVLDWLTNNHLVHKISGENRAWKFQLSLQKHKADTHHHGHLLCTSCGKISCIHDLPTRLPKTILDKYHVKEIDIHVKGLCDVCFKASITP